ncbi:UL1 protein [Gallid alphaherpesvirus 3]|uniref:UL1 protein n=2 Tax=Gallid alphaherpesvirus 3 TaxID=35250 RepID=Q782U6_9ALPH|nr:envelope glycoprotein L [Gallid alphaherpesvirus 3]YP_010795593.1 UL1-like protein [Gallid alphaherpesvirus 3]BAA82894.1 UL1 product homolog [Marek's disease virus serotype 2 MDV2]AEI00202.1 UL1-like protein [Gallid alphaherpesvirus 3]QEY02280.1 UL1-like protein [Gallid alphaherpesvirus 3]BAB16508.1 UL1 protein [Gallid alphaherpesvirus 3]
MHVSLVWVLCLLFGTSGGVLKWSDVDLSRGFISVPNVSSLMLLDCAPNSILSTARFADLTTDDVPTGIFIKINCSVPEFILWYGSKSVAARLNPIIASALMMDDVLKSGLDDSVKAELRVFLKRISERLPWSSLRKRHGCLNLDAPYDFSCYGSARLDRFERDIEDDGRGMSCRAKSTRAKAARTNAIEG